MAPSDTTRKGVEAELRMAIWTGHLVDWRTGDTTADDPANGAGWDAQRTIAAALLADLLTSTLGSHRPRALQLAGARIIGQLDLGATELVCPLLLQACWFAEPLVLAEAQAPAVRLPGCHLPGLSADQLTTRGNLGLNNGFTATREVCLGGAHIGGILDLRGATLINPKRVALNADGLTVDHDMFCSEGSIATGKIAMFGANTGRSLDLSRKTQFCARGEVRLGGAHIGGILDLRGATLINPKRVALNADGLTVDHDMFCSKGFTARGEVDLLGAHIGGSLNLRGATLTNRKGLALTADRLTVDHDMFCSEGFTATGEVRLGGAHIEGSLDLSGATLTNPNGERTVLLQELRAGMLFLRDLTRDQTEPPELVDFTHAEVSGLADEPGSWPRRAYLDGFVYDALYDRRQVRARRRLGWLARDPRGDRPQPYEPVRARQRLDWLARDPRGYRPQPYEQLAAVYRRAGRDHDARKVAIAKQWRQRRTLNPLGKLWNLLLYATVGYGYRMWLAIAWLLVLVGLGWWLFDRAHPAHLVAAKPPGQRPWFHSAVYALDLLLPFADLGYQGAWIATGSARWLFLAWHLAGWVLTTAVVAALTGLLRRD